MDKVKITRELANGINAILSKYKSGIEYDIEALGNEQTSSCEGIKVVYDFVHESRDNMQLYFSALVNGYEVEETPEDKIHNEYRMNTGTIDRHCVGVVYGIKFTLEALGIKIEGVNHE